MLCFGLLNVTPQLSKYVLVVFVMCSQWPHSGEGAHPSVVLARALGHLKSECRRVAREKLPADDVCLPLSAVLISLLSFLASS